MVFIYHAYLFIDIIDLQKRETKGQENIHTRVMSADGSKLESLGMQCFLTEISSQKFHHCFAVFKNLLRTVIPV